mmetsp:Transcript_17353/g.19328  ORF Transcript_17353/g.19328 Transcript_17353/m.19328 type:complete len:208 (-) Transcript_17353:65-688(-)
MITAIDADLTKMTPDEVVEGIEAAEEGGDVVKVVTFLDLTSSNEYGGEEDWAEAAEAALDALYRLVKGGASVVSSSDNYLKAVFDSLNAWEEEDAIVEVGLGCIVSIASKADKESSKDGDDVNDTDEIPVEFVLDLMKDFEDEQTIQEQSCLAMEGLALWKKRYKNVLAAAEGIKEELLAARDQRITNERNKAYPVRAAKALGIKLE